MTLTNQVVGLLNQKLSQANDILNGIGFDRGDGVVECSQIEPTNTINGGPGFNLILGTLGDDRINGFEGTDLIIGGPGNDQIYGGGGLY